MYSAVEIKAGKIRIGKNKIKRTKQEKRRIIEVKVMEKWKIWNNKEEVARSKKEVKKLVLKQFHK